MSFLVIVAVFVIVQYLEAGEGLHQDSWWQRWAARVNDWSLGDNLTLLLQVVAPVVVAWLLLDWLAEVSSFLLFLISIPLLLYCLGRGDFSEWVKGYIEAYHRGDNEVAAEYAGRLGVLAGEFEGWGSLHRAVLRRASYRAIERTFVVFFWFFLLGIAGALLYRLSCFARQHQNNSDEQRELAARLAWLLEWPVVRVLGLSLALSGNFLGAFQAVQQSLFCYDKASEDELEALVHGALNVNGKELVSETVTEQEVEALQPLFSRTLILWMCFFALVSLF